MNPQPIAIAVVELNDSFLVGERQPGGPLAGYHEFPGGKVHPGEAPEAAAVRECLEESGLSVVVVRELPSRTHRYDFGTVDLRFFACRVAETSRPLEPKAPFTWVARMELEQLRFPEGNRALLALLLEDSPTGHPD